jgi:hypothetical protein
MSRLHGTSRGLRKSIVCILDYFLMTPDEASSLTLGMVSRKVFGPSRTPSKKLRVCLPDHMANFERDEKGDVEHNQLGLGARASPKAAPQIIAERRKRVVRVTSSEEWRARNCMKKTRAQRICHERSQSPGASCGQTRTHG